MEENGAEDSGLNPRERVVERLVGQGLSDAEIAWRFRRSPGHIQRLRQWSQLRVSPHQPRARGEHSPVERTVLRSRDQGASHAEIAARLRRSPAFVERVERMAGLRRARRATA